MKAKEQILTKDLRETIKKVMEKELLQLPDLLEKLDPKERLTILCKILPFTLPRIENISHNEGESLTW